MAPVVADQPQGGFGDSSETISATENSNDYMVDIPVNTKRWAHPLRKNFDPTERVDLTETVLFSSASVVQGSTQGSFYLSDLITKFRITVNAIDVNGAIGYQRSSL